MLHTKYFFSILERTSLAEDFNHYYVSSRLLLKGVSPYGIDLSSTPEGQNFIWSQQSTQATNPPFLVLFFLLFGIFSPDSAWRLWIACGCVSLFAAIILVLRLEKSLELLTLLVSALFVFSSDPVLDTLIYAQIQPLLLALLLLGLFFLQREQGVFAGACVGLVTALKLFTWPIFFFFIASRSYGAGLSFVVTFLLCCLLPELLYPELGLSENFVFSALPHIEWWRFNSTLNVGIQGLTHVSLLVAFDLPIDWANQHPTAARCLDAVFALLAAGLVAVVARKLCKTDIRLAYVLSVLVAFIFAPVAWPHYFIVMLAPALMLWVRSARHKGANLFLFIVWLILSARPIFRMLREEISEVGAALLLFQSIHLIIALALILLLMREHSGRDSAQCC